jgi:hypothetical protein
MTSRHPVSAARLVIGALATVVVAGLVSCTPSTILTQIDRTPDAGPLQFKRGDKVVALVLAESADLRRNGETTLAKELDRRGLVGVPSYTLIAAGQERDREAAKAAFQAAGAAGVVAMRPKGSKEEVSIGAGTYGGSFWDDYYDYGWDSSYMYVPGGIVRETYVSVETLIFDLRQDKMVWKGQSQSVDPSSLATLIRQIADAVGADLRKSGLIAAG